MFKKVFLVLVLVVSSLDLGKLATANNLDSSIAYIKSQAGNPWSTIALSALGQPDQSHAHLKDIRAMSVIELTAPILAIISLGENPKTFSNTNLISQLEEWFSNGQIGNPNLTNDDAFGVMALLASGASKDDEIINATIQNLLNLQNTDGGWPLTVGDGSDTNSTAAVITALINSGISTNDERITKAYSYLKSSQNPDGGFPYDRLSQFGSDSDTPSTAWVIWALLAADIKPEMWTKEGKSPTDFLSARQTTSGYFEFQSGTGLDAFSPITTAYALIALSGKPFPIIKTFSKKKPEISIRIEGKDDTVCSTKLASTNALEAVILAADRCDFDYEIKQTSFGPYLTKIGSDTAFDSKGWIFLVNHEPASVGADAYRLSEGDEVLWNFGEFDAAPLRITLNRTEILEGQSVTGTVESWTAGSWQPKSQARILAGAANSITDQAGIFTLNLPTGFYRVKAEFPGFIRSDKVNFTVGSPPMASLDLTAEYNPALVQGTSTDPNTSEFLAFTVNASGLDFGQVGPGYTREKTFTVNNTGTGPINLTSAVSGDSIFTQGLSVNGKPWSAFSSILEQGSSKEFPAALKIPTGFQSTAGSKYGKLTIWASQP